MILLHHLHQNWHLPELELFGFHFHKNAWEISNTGELNTFKFNAAQLTSGVFYYYRLISDAKVEKKMLLMK